MKIGIYFAYWEYEWKGDFHAYIDKVSSLGFDVLELSCAGLPDNTDELRSLRDHAKDKGLVLTAGYGPSKEHSLSSKDPDVVSRGKTRMAEMLRKLSILDIGIICGGLQSYWPADYSHPVDKKREWEISVDNIRYMADIAAGYGVTLCLETLNRFEAYLINTAKECRLFVEEVGHKNVGIMLDTFHMNIEEDSFYDAIIQAGDLLRHVHLGEANRRVPGKGRLPWKEIGRALNEISYDGSCVMEPFVLTGGTVGHEIRVWRDIEKDTSLLVLDADAKRSLEFTRFMFEKD